MATVKLIPSTYSVSNSSYLSVSNHSNMYTNCDSETYATVTNSQTGTSSYYIYIKGFNFSDIPSDAEVTSFTVRFKARESGITISSYYPYICNNTTTIQSVSTMPSTTAKTIEFTNLTSSWETIKGYGSNFGIRLNCRRASRNTTGYMYIYGAEIEVTYSDAVKYNVSVSCTGGTSNPSGTVEAEENSAFTVNAVPDEGYEFSSMTVNGVSVQPSLATSNGIENGVTLMHCNNSNTDELGNSTITSTGSFSSSVKKFGTHSISLSGSNYIQIDLPQSYSPITVECWFYCTQSNASGSYPTLFSTNTTASSGGTYMHIDDGSYSTTTVCRSNAAGASGNNGGYGSTAISRNAWHHFAYCRNGSSHLFFIDGQLEYTVSQSSADDIETIYLGCLRKTSGFDSACYMTGYIDEVMISSVCKYTSSFNLETSEFSTSSSEYYTYTIPSITGDTSIIVVFTLPQDGTGTSIKLNGVWIEAQEVYKKINGVWVKQTDYSSVFDSEMNYIYSST